MQLKISLKFLFSVAPQRSIQTLALTAKMHFSRALLTNSLINDNGFLFVTPIFHNSYVLALKGFLYKPWFNGYHGLPCWCESLLMYLLYNSLVTIVLLSQLFTHWNEMWKEPDNLISKNEIYIYISNSALPWICARLHFVYSTTSMICSWYWSIN